MEKKGVIWVSTVLYILITIAVLGIAFAALKPEIDKMRDKAIIEQSIGMMNEFDKTINQVKEVSGTRREIRVVLKKGTLVFDFDAEDNKIVWQFNTAYKYSEPGIGIEIGNIIAKTTKVTGAYFITLTLNYDENLLYGEDEKEKIITASELPYTFFIENSGDGVINIYTPSED